LGGGQEWGKHDGLYGGGHSEHGAGGRSESDRLASRIGSGPAGEGRRLANFFLWQRENPGVMAGAAVHDMFVRKAI
jgi:hypothetical protein